MLTATLTIPVDDEITGGVMDDVDEDGRNYSRTIDGPATYTVEYYENEPPGPPGEFWIIPDEALAIPMEDIPAEWITNKRSKVDTTSSIARIALPELSDFGKQLLAEGFRVFVFRSDVERVAKGGKESCATHIGFSRIVDEQECFASVSRGVAGYQFSMPIKPSREHGSSMFISNKPDTPEFDSLTLDNAELYASPTGRNPLVGTQKNYKDLVWQDRLYIEVTG